MTLKSFFIFAFFASSFAQDLSCDFTMAAGEYTCLFTINNPDGLEFESVGGTHMEGMSDLNVTSVSRSAGNSSIIPSIFCTQFPNLQTLNIVTMTVQNLTNDPFSSCSNLIWLSLWNNQISEVPVNTFANNRGLNYLDLDRNQLPSLPLNVFQGLSNLTILELRNNPFEGRLAGNGHN